MNRRLVSTTLAVFFALPASTFAATASGGKVSLHGSSWDVADAVAFRDGDELRVAFSDTPFDVGAMQRDGKLNLFDVLRHSGQTVTLNFDKDGPSSCIDFYVRAGDVQRSGSQCDGAIEEAFSDVRNDATQTVGALDWQNGDNRLQLRWELTLLQATGGGETDGAGAALPADGGEPGKAVLAHFAALQKGDWAAFKALAEPERQAMMSESEATGEHLGMFEMLRSFAAHDVKITGGRIHGDTATIEFSGTSDGQPVRGRAEVNKVGDRWYFAGSELEDGA